MAKLGRRDERGALVPPRPPNDNSRLTRLYGAARRKIDADVESAPSLGDPLLPGCEALRAEVLHALTREGARTADDVLRRRLMLLPPPVGAAQAIRHLCVERGVSLAEEPA